MSKLITLLFITVGLVVLFNIAGFQTNTNYLLQQVGLNINNDNPVQGLSNFKNSNLLTAINYAIIALVGLGIVGGISLGFIKPAQFTIVITAGLGAVLLLFLGDLISVVSYFGAGEKWIGTLVYLIMAPIIIIYIWVIYDWIKGGG